MRVFPFFFLCVCAISTLSFSQKQGNNWILGENGLDFSEGYPPKVVTGFAGAQTGEGNASYSDCNGNLLFYTNGISVFDASNQIMKNGNELVAGGIVTSSIQAALVVPMPGESNKYYLFSNDGFPTSNGLGVFYSIIDMNLIGNGTFSEPLGEVISKNNLLQPATSEGLTGTIHSNGTDYWIFLSDFPSNKLLTYQISSTGIGLPIEYEIPEIETISTIKSSTDGRRVAITNFSFGSKKVILLNFDNSNGQFTFLEEIEDIGSSIPGMFSANGDVFYSFNSSFIYQYDLKSSNIKASEIELGSVGDDSFFFDPDMQLAPNGELIIFTSTFNNDISVVLQPDDLGANCLFKNKESKIDADFIWLPNAFLYHKCSDTTVFLDDVSASIPNVLTPNGDQLNDFFIISNLDKQPKKKLKIYDRWGSLVYTSTDYLNDWSGKDNRGRELFPGTYFYILELSDKEVAGFLTLISD